MTETQAQSSGKPEPYWINIRITPALRQRLERLADKNQRALGREASVAIMQYVEREEKAAA